MALRLVEAAAGFRNSDQTGVWHPDTDGPLYLKFLNSHTWPTRYVCPRPSWVCHALASAASAGFVVCRAQRFGGESPLTNLMEVKI